MNQQESTNLDPRTLGQLLLMQSILPTLPDETSIFHFVCRGLSHIPGVAAVNHSEAIQENIDPSIARFPLAASGSEYGEFLFQVSDPLAFALYSDYIKNFSFMVAVILRNVSSDVLMNCTRLNWSSAFKTGHCNCAKKL